MYIIIWKYHGKVKYKMSENNKYKVKELDISYFDEIKKLFKDVFTNPPWNDDWSDDVQLDNYLHDLMETRMPLILGFYENEDLQGIAIGNIRHWWGGTEYYIEEVCIRTKNQKKGYGTKFMSMIEELLIEKDIHQIFLMTERNVPAFDFYKKLGFNELKEHVSFFKEF